MASCQPASPSLATLPDLVLTLLFDRLDATTLTTLRLVSRSYNQIVINCFAFSLISKLENTLAALPVPPDKLQLLVFALSDLKARNPVNPPEPFGLYRSDELEQYPYDEADTSFVGTPDDQQNTALSPFHFDAVTVLFDRKYLSPRVCRYRVVEVRLPSGATVILILQMRKTLCERSEIGDAHLSMVLPSTEQYPGGEYVIFRLFLEGSYAMNFEIQDADEAAARAASILGIERSAAHFKAVVDAVCLNVYQMGDAGEKSDMEKDFCPDWQGRYHVVVPEEFVALVNVARSRLLSSPPRTTAAVVNGMIPQIRMKQAVIGLRRLEGFCGMMKAMDCADPPTAISNYFYDRNAGDHCLVDWFRNHLNVIESWSEQVPSVYMPDYPNRRKSLMGGLHSKGLEMKVVFELKVRFSRTFDPKTVIHNHFQPADPGRKPVRIIFYHRIGLNDKNVLGQSTCFLHAIVDTCRLTIIDVHCRNRGYDYNPHFSDSHDWDLRDFRPTLGSEEALTTVLEYLSFECPPRDFMRLLIAGAYASTVRVVAFGLMEYSIEDVLLKGGDHLSVYHGVYEYPRERAWDREATGAPSVEVAKGSGVGSSAGVDVGSAAGLGIGGVGTGRESSGVETSQGLMSGGAKWDVEGSDVNARAGGLNTSSAAGSHTEVNRWDALQSELERTRFRIQGLRATADEHSMQLAALKGASGEVSRGDGEADGSQSRPERTLSEEQQEQAEWLQSNIHEIRAKADGYEREEASLKRLLAKRAELEAFEKEEAEWEGPWFRTRCGMQEDVRLLFNALWGRD
ncbi:hypothetical protein HDV00_011676 [Rhizophlyctis rosea]|nr:hypothetical protein HDV00_011676 [Rhizophlyctis rosea]